MAGLGAVARERLGGGAAAWAGDAGGVTESDGDHACVWSGQCRRELEETLSADEVRLEGRTERVAAPANAGCGAAAAPDESVVQGRAKRGLWKELRGDGSADNVKESVAGQALAGQQTIGGRPVGLLQARSGEQAGHGVSSEAEQGAEQEGLGEVGDAGLGEAGPALLPEMLEVVEEATVVFFSVGVGGLRRRRASKDLSSMIHSKDSPRENSKA